MRVSKLRVSSCPCCGDTASGRAYVSWATTPYGIHVFRYLCTRTSFDEYLASSPVQLTTHNKAVHGAFSFPTYSTATCQACKLLQATALSFNVNIMSVKFFFTFSRLPGRPIAVPHVRAPLRVVGVESCLVPPPSCLHGLSQIAHRTTLIYIVTGVRCTKLCVTLRNCHFNHCFRHPVDEMPPCSSPVLRAGHYQRSHSALSSLTISPTCSQRVSPRHRNGTRLAWCRRSFARPNSSVHATTEPQNDLVSTQHDIKMQSRRQLLAQVTLAAVVTASGGTLPGGLPSTACAGEVSQRGPAPPPLRHPTSMPMTTPDLQSTSYVRRPPVAPTEATLYAVSTAGTWHCACPSVLPCLPPAASKHSHHARRTRHPFNFIF